MVVWGAGWGARCCVQLRICLVEGFERMSDVVIGYEQVRAAAGPSLLGGEAGWVSIRNFKD